MKRIFTIAALGIWTVEAFAAQTPVTTITAPASGNVSLRTYNNTYVNPKLSTIESNRLDHETRVSAVESDKADKTAVIRYWSDWPDVSPGNTLAVGTIVAFDGKLYKVTQEFVKTEGATPAALTSYFSEVTGSDYTLPTASADTLGGVKVGDRLTITDGVLSADVQSGGATAINDLTDVDTTGKAEGKLLKFDASGNLVVGTDDTGSGSVPDGTVNGQVLLWSTDQWVASAFPGITAYPGAGIPNSTGSAWGTSYTVDTDLSSVSASDDSLPSAKATKTALDLKANSSSLGTASTLNVGTSPGNVVQLGGACTVGDGTYTDQSTCESNSGQWVGVLSIICDSDTEDCNTKLDLISAYEIDQRIAVKQDAMGADDNYVTDAEKIKLANLSGTNTGDQDLSGYQLALTVPDQAEAEAGTATIERAWTAQRIAQAIAALAPGDVDEIVYQADCSTITNGFCIDTDDGSPYYWDGSAVTAISDGIVDLTNPGPIGSVTPNTGAFTTVTAASFDTSAPASGETGEIGLQEDPVNGTNTITLKAPANMATDLVFTMPNAYAGAANSALVDDGTGTLSFVDVVLTSEIGQEVQPYDADLTDLAADGSLSGEKVGSGISAANITTGTLPDARLSTLVPKWVATVPTTATDACTAGTAAYDSSYIYVCVAADTWVRTALSTW